MPKQDKVQIINQRRRRPTDSLGVSGAGGAFVPPGTITLTTGNTVGTTHTHELDIESLASLGLGHVLRIVAATGTVVDYGVTTEDALTGALGAGAAGDVVLLPACEVAGDHVVPAGVTLLGRGLATVLTGQLTLGAGAEGRGLYVERDEDDPDPIYGVTTGESGDDAWLVACYLVVTNSGPACGVTTGQAALWLQTCYVDVASEIANAYGYVAGNADIHVEGGVCVAGTAPVGTEAELEETGS